MITSKEKRKICFWIFWVLAGLISIGITLTFGWLVSQMEGF